MTMSLFRKARKTSLSKFLKQLSVQQPLNGQQPLSVQLLQQLNVQLLQQLNGQSFIRLQLLVRHTTTQAQQPHKNHHSLQISFFICLKLIFRDWLKV